MRKGALLVPQRAVTELQGSYQVATVDPENKAHIKTVQVGEQIGSDWLIESGLAPNDRVIAEGTQKIKEGALVNPQPYRSLPGGPASGGPARGRQAGLSRDDGAVGIMYRFFINRPIVAMVIAILMVLVGVVSMLTLPISQFPSVVPPEIRIQTTFVGADAETVQQSIATPIEEQMSGVDNMNYMYSINANNGVMRMVVNFDVKTDPNIDQMLAQLREAQAASQLPAAVQNYGVTILKSPTTPMLLVALYSPHGTYDATFLANYAYINLVDQITRVKGISNINVFGAGQYAMRFWVKPDQLAKLNITVSDVIAAVNSQNTVNPAGQVGGPPSAARPGVHLHRHRPGPPGHGRSNLAKSSCARTRTARWCGSRTWRASNWAPRFTTWRAGSTGKPSAVLAIYQLPGSNALDAARGVKELMDATETAISAGPGLRRVAGHHAGGQPGRGGNPDDAVGGAAAGGPGRIYLPARLAGHADSAAGRAGVAHRNLHPLSHLRLFHQHAVPLRFGAGHRLGGG